MPCVLRDSAQINNMQELGQEHNANCELKWLLDED